MVKLKFEDLTIEIYDDPVFLPGSTDNSRNYLKHYFGDGALEHPAARHGIKILDNDIEINNCIVIGSGGVTGVIEHSVLLDGDKILVCCCNTLFCLSVPGLELCWQTKADWATCFEVFKLDNDYLVHGELQISRIDSSGKIKWQFQGQDIWVCLGNKNPFNITPDFIQLFDFCNKEYKIDFNGELL